MVKAVKTITNLPLIVGGGIRTGKMVKELVRAGANVIVTGNILEENQGKHKIQELIKSINPQ